MGQAKRRQDTIKLLKDRHPNPSFWGHELVPANVTLKDGTSYTASDVKDFHSEWNVARHEAAHAVACVLVGEHLVGIQFNDGDDYLNFGECRSVHQASTGTGIPIPEMITKTAGERFVHACHQAFITLSGVFGGGDAASSNPIRQYETRSHCDEACAKFSLLSGAPDDVTSANGIRILEFTATFWDDAILQRAIDVVAEQLIARRYLSGEYATALIREALGSRLAAAVGA